MAALQTLRNKAGWFIAIIIAVALLAFILTDLLGSGNSIFQDNDTIGKANGQKIKYQAYQNLIEERESFAKLNGQNVTDDMQNQIREDAWREMVNDVALTELFENAGIEVTSQEVLDMATGQHIAPALRQLFANPNTGQYDREFAKNFLMNKSADPNANFYWYFIEKELRRSRALQKYNSLLTGGVYQTKAEREDLNNLRAKNRSAQFVGVRYALIPDSVVAVSNGEIASLYNKHKEQYKTDALRSIEYVSFPVRPTAADRQDTEAAVAAMIPDFKAADDPLVYAQMNAENPENATFRTAESISPSVLRSFVDTASVGAVYGPYREGNGFKLVRLVDAQMRPDSVRASHILVRNQALADSLFGEVKKQNADFAAVARKYSEDTGSAVNGGDLDWFKEGMMVSEFNDACFTARNNDIVMVRSQFGIHIIKVTGTGGSSKKYLLAQIDKSVVAGAKTRQTVYAEAQTFASKNTKRIDFDMAVDTLNLVRRYATNIRTTASTINNLRQAREIVKWAFAAKEDEVSPLFEVNSGDEYVVALMLKAQEKGYQNIDDVSAVLKQDLLREKKAALISKETEGMDLAAIAAKYNVNVDTVEMVKYIANSVTGAGSEPALVGAILSAEQGQQKGMLQGNNAVYAFKVTNETSEKVDETDYMAARMREAQNLSYYANQMIQENVEVEDYRLKFY